MKIITREEAKKLKLKRYFSGVSCIRNHISERWTINQQCVQCYEEKRSLRLEEIKIYKRNYHIKNIDKISKKRGKYYQENKEIIINKVLEWQKNNKEKVNLKNKIWKRNNYKKVLSTNNNYKLNFPERIKDSRKKYASKNKELIRSYTINRRAKIKGCEGNYNPGDIKKLLVNQKHKCASCYISVNKGYHIDHIKPLSKGGTNWPENLQILCPTCNLRKNAKDPIVWANENGRLL